MRLLNVLNTLALAIVLPLQLAANNMSINVRVI